MAEPAGVVAVAASGGRDSTALLHATARLAAGWGLQVVALHIHHGLNPLADAWQRQVQRQCARWAAAGLPVRCLVRRLDGQPAPGDSVEAWARRERYAALAELAQAAGASLVLLAQHRRDQAETVLLQLLRGGGPAGLAAMPRARETPGLVWARPWLAQPREAIEHYLARWRLGWVEDDSNLDARFARNRLRHQLWPALTAAFPDAEAALALSAREAARAAALAEEVAQADLATVGGPGLPDTLDLAAWRGLSEARRAGVLRHWLRAHRQAHAQPQAGPRDGVRHHLIERLLAELPGAPGATWPVGAGQVLRVYRGRLHLLPAPADAPAHAAPGNGKGGPPDEVEIDWTRLGEHAVPGWPGTLVLHEVTHGGAPLALLRTARLRARRAGDDFQCAPRGCARALKKQFQARGVPEWARHAPLVATDEQVVFVPALGLDARARARPGEPQRAIEWRPAPAGAPSACVGPAARPAG